jgi:hypothetical protein
MVVPDQGDWTQFPGSVNGHVETRTEQEIMIDVNQISFVYSDLTMTQMHILLFTFICHLNTAYVKLFRILKLLFWMIISKLWPNGNVMQTYIRLLRKPKYKRAMGLCYDVEQANRDCNAVPHWPQSWVKYGGRPITHNRNTQFRTDWSSFLQGFPKNLMQNLIIDLAKYVTSIQGGKPVYPYFVSPFRQCIFPCP